jgi:hypothetical protein
VHEKRVYLAVSSGCFEYQTSNTASFAARRLKRMRFAHMENAAIEQSIPIENAMIKATECRIQRSGARRPKWV